MVAVHRSMVPALRALRSDARRAGIDIEFISGYRSTARQAALYKAYLARGKTGTPVAPPGRSYHNFGLAVDFRTVPRTAAAVRTVGLLAERRGFRWGGRFGDPHHIDTGNLGADRAE